MDSMIECVVMVSNYLFGSFRLESLIVYVRALKVDC